MAVLVGVFYCIIVLVTAASPDFLLSLLDWTSPLGLYTSIAINMVVALMLLWAAPSSRWPPVLNFIGGLALIETFIYLMIPIESWVEQFNFWMIEQLTFTGLKLNGADETTDGDLVHSILCSTKYNVSRPSGNELVTATCRAWVRSW